MSLIRWSSSLLVAVILAVVANSSAMDRSENHDLTKAPPFDHFLFAQEWPQSVCIDNNITGAYPNGCTVGKKVKTWIVHGLWPAFKDTTSSTNCTGPEFDKRKLKSISKELEKYWASLFNKMGCRFWEHEWNFHGKCARSFRNTSSQLEYFKKGLQMNRKFDIWSILKKRGIIPNNSNGYTSQEVRGALTSALKYQPHVSCAYNNVTNTQYLAQIKVCVDKTFSLRNCGHNGLAEQHTESSMPFRKDSDTTFGPCNTTQPIYYCEPSAKTEPCKS